MTLLFLRFFTVLISITNDSYGYLSKNQEQDSMKYEISRPNENIFFNEIRRNRLNSRSIPFYLKPIDHEIYFSPSMGMIYKKFSVPLSRIGSHFLLIKGFNYLFHYGNELLYYGSSNTALERRADCLIVFSDPEGYNRIRSIQGNHLHLSKGRTLIKKGNIGIYKITENFYLDLYPIVPYYIKQLSTNR